MMGTFVTAYLAAWLAVMLYLLRLGARQRRLEQNLEALQSQFDRMENPKEPASEAA
jgi:CcmD family protein